MEKLETAANRQVVVHDWRWVSSPYNRQNRNYIRGFHYVSEQLLVDPCGSNDSAVFFQV